MDLVSNSAAALALLLFASANAELIVGNETQAANATNVTTPDIWAVCQTAKEGGPLEKCFRGVTWAMKTGIHVHREWYPWHQPGMEFEDFQTAFHDDPSDRNECLKLPCPKTTTTTTTTTSTAPPGTPPCPERKQLPPLPEWPTDNNGISWPEYCYTGYDDEHVFFIGDWGGLTNHHAEDYQDVRVADNTQGKDWRNFHWGLDDKAQIFVAEQMNKRAAVVNPRYILNAGDNFYWGGIKDDCSKYPFGSLGNTNQWFPVFEDMYKGPGMDGKPWLSTLGNHDYGGFQFNKGWDQQIAYTYGGSPSGRWLLPGQYWHQHVDYLTKNFSVDYYMVDTQIFDAKHPYHDPGHNICSYEHNGKRANCAPYGPKDPWDCLAWFQKLWKDQLAWLDKKLNESTADWQIIVSHFPPQWRSWGSEDWRILSDKYGIDLFVGAHRHQQELHEWGEAHMPWVVTGGGGGVTSEADPHNWGNGLDQYGFMDMTINKEQATIEAINQWGEVRRSMTIKPREGLWQKQQHEPEPLAEIEVEVQKRAYLQQDLYNQEKEPEITCDGMGELLKNNTCDASFAGAQVKGVLRMTVSDVGGTISNTDAQDAVRAAIASLAGVQELMDVTISLSPSRSIATATFRRLAYDTVDATFSIEVPSHEKVEEIGHVLNSKSVAQMNTVLWRSPALRYYGAEAVSLYVNGFHPQSRSAELRSATPSGGLPVWACVFLLLLGLGIFVMGVVTLQSVCISKDGKRGNLTYTLSESVIEDSSSEAELNAVDSAKF